jgi:hypothetical protein
MFLRGYLRCLAIGKKTDNFDYLMRRTSQRLSRLATGIFEIDLICFVACHKSLA